MTNAEARFNKIHIRKVYACLAVTCHLHFLAEWPGFFTCYCGNTGGGTDTEIRVSTESRPWRRKFSRRSSRDSNPRPFNHESGALTTELSPPPQIWDRWFVICRPERRVPCSTPQQSVDCEVDRGVPPVGLQIILLEGWAWVISFCLHFSSARKWQTKWKWALLDGHRL